ncbi:hypothetical protein BU23DRAFT_460478, partial [Bimuria novae-zelandiae CBS 107.79]
IWVDTVYINQKDVLERNAQVAMMGKIFESAALVVCWFGPAAEDSDVACEII